MAAAAEDLEMMDVDVEEELVGADGGEGEEQGLFLSVLPPELRNRIYREVLVVVDDGVTNINKSNYAQPALLRTCKQIRHETRGIYYLENRFSVQTYNFDCSLLKLFCKQADGLWSNYNNIGMSTSQSKSPQRCQISIEGSDTDSSWSNLHDWLEAYHRDEVIMFECFCFGNDLCCQATRLMNVVRTLNAVPWAAVEKTLCIMKDAVDTQNPYDWLWTDDGDFNEEEESDEDDSEDDGGEDDDSEDDDGENDDDE